MSLSGQTIESTWRHGALSLNDPPDRAMMVSQLLLAHALKCDRAYLLSYPEKELLLHDKTDYDSFLARYRGGEPLAYICGMTEFYSLQLMVNEHVLIPRPETELLVDEALAVLTQLSHSPSILDMGTGSGAIAISLAMALPNAKVTALDVSTAALSVAVANAKYHGCEQINFVHSNWFDSLLCQQFDCIVSNPPYLTAHEWQMSQELHKEPSDAFIGGDDGLVAYREIAQHAKHYLKPGGIILFEHGYQQADAVRDILQAARYRDVFSVYDLLGHERVTGATM